MQNHSKVSDATVCTCPVVSAVQPQGWADLPDGLLHSIIALSGSFLEPLAIAGTCRSWRAAFSSYPSKSAFRTSLPPLLIRPHVGVQAPHLPSSNGHQKLRTCQVIDLANRSKALRCQIPQETFQEMKFAGNSYGQLICCHRGCCLVIDVFTGAQVSPPRLPYSDGHEEIYFCGMLTAPLSSPNSHLLISDQCSLYDWPVGSDSWSELKFDDLRVDQIVDFNGQFIALAYNRIFTLQLVPQLGLQEIETVWWEPWGGDDMDRDEDEDDMNRDEDELASDDEDTNVCPYLRPCLVVCGDMLLIVDHYITLSFEPPVLYKPYHLDMSTEPAKWVEVKKLDNWALLISDDVRNQPFSCMNPERWGGRSNCLYYAHYSQPWSLHGLGSEAVAKAVWDPSTDPDLVFKRNWYSQLQALWVYPSMFYSAGQ